MVAARPVMSLNGRAAVNQNSGDVADDEHGKPGERAVPTIPVEHGNSFTSARTANPPAMTPSRLSACTSDSPSAARHFRRADEQRITGRMRLMLRDVVVADAEREVDGIEIFERGRKKRQVQREEHGGQDRRQGGDRIGSRRSKEQTLVEAAGAVTLEVDRDVAVADRLQFADDGWRRSRARAHGRNSSRPSSMRARSS